MRYIVKETLFRALFEVKWANVECRNGRRIVRKALGG